MDHSINAAAPFNEVQALHDSADITLHEVHLQHSQK
jgi:hypothetical protein